MNIVVNPDLKAYIDPLTREEHEALERSLLAEGCRDALVLWGDVLVDGHNRFSICQQHGIPFHTRQNTLFKSMGDVQLWMIEQHLGRRSVSDFQRGVLALRKREILHERRQQALVRAAAQPAAAADDTTAAAVPVASEGLLKREDIARAARLSSSQVLMIERIQKTAAAEVVAALKSGSISLNAAAAVASLPEPEQVVAAQGGREELQQAARRVRDSKKRAKVEVTEEAGDDATADSVPALQARIHVLEAENAQLRAQLAALA
jgi:hypothetical protein